MIRAVLFDMGNTLVTSLETPEITQKILKEKGIKKTRKQIQKAMTKAAKVFRESHDHKELLAMNFDDFYVEWDTEILRQLGIDDPELGRYAHDRFFDVAELGLYDDVLPVLNRLSAMGLRLGLVTNGYYEEAKEVLERIFRTYIKGQMERIHLNEDMFSVIVGRDTTMADKPDPRPFLHAAGSLGLKPDEIIFVGDSFKNDYEGSQGAGMMPVLILTGRKIPPEAPDDITTIENLDEIMEIIQ